MGRFSPSPLSAELSALHQQALQHLAATDAASLAAEPPAELLYHTMLTLQRQELHRAQAQIKALQQAAAVAAAHATAAADPAADKFRRLFEHSSDAVFLLLDNYFVDCNAAMLALIGATDKQQLLGQHMAELAPSHQPDGHPSRERADDYCRLAIAQGRHRYEWLGQRCTGEEFWGEILLTPVQMDTHTLLHAVWRDTTPLKMAEQQRRESEEDRRRVLAAAGVGTVIYILGSKEVVLDERARALLGLPPAAGPLPSTEVIRQVYPEDLVPASEIMTRAQQTGQPVVLEFRVVWADNSIHHIRFRGEIEKKEGQPGRLLGVMRDISAKRQAQEELSYKNRLLEHVVHNMPLVLGRLSNTGVFLELIGLGLRHLNIQDNQLRGVSTFEAFPEHAEPMRRLLAGESVKYVTFVVEQGERIYYQNYGFFDQERHEAVIFAIDVTESEQTKQKLHAEKAFTKQVIDHSPDALIALDLNLRVTAWNQKVAQYASVPEEKAIGQSFFELLPHHLETAEFPHLLEQVRQGKSITLFNQTLGRRPGSYDIYCVPLQNPDSSEVTGILITIRDITERNRMLAAAVQLQRQQQQAVVRAVFAAQEAERKRIAEALHNGVGQLLYVTKLTLENGSRFPPDPAVLQVLNEAIQATRNVSHQLTPGILEDFGLQVALQELVKHIPQGTLKVYLHLTGLHQLRPLLLELAVYRIIQELLSNVIKHAHAHEVHIQVEHEDDQVVLSVQDDGRGMPATPLPAADPGMGIVSIRNRAELLGGRFSLDSHPELGTTVRVALPIPAKSQ
ncbi:PAS/PAC sensor signal transduction histidine kinase [Hymenobacter roseosalivarius DSM 11622]|uniref:histidine kinase n=1 Tax=Hymenobacter roseosalivarius DSM 11622 TaxID=645990 RepID=A0A1W1VFB0_9BACT|nr:PAS domain S-box protein [Hymenobacter roseosalivarius]SMB91900.1 PAS/PAC sensor signal transduction histidine kinase [Hymenobacter roseosalivarius DSM 11622]